jgi:LEA14-like dessication related protein
LIGKRNLHLFSLFVLTVSVFACKQPLAPDYHGLESVTITKIGLNESRVDAVVKFYNPNNFKLQLKYADIDILANNNFIGHCIIDSSINIPRQDSFYIAVSVNIDLKNIMGNAVQFLLKGQVKINADGFVRLKKSAIKFKIPVHYEQFERIDSLLQQIH